MKHLYGLYNCPAPAKLNLYLHVTGRRADGYHEIETLFELIDLGDRLDFQARDDGQVVMNSPLPGVPAEQDLCVRAARLLARSSGCGHGVSIHVRKAIPMGAGLGGGSSDAASTLLALNQLWELHWPVERLASLALKLGADVPVFVHGTPAYATGIGEQISPVSTCGLPARLYLLLLPAVAIPTAAIFADPELTRDTKPMRISGLSRGLHAYRGRNDLEAVACRRYPAVARALEVLRQVAQSHDAECARLTRMSGSGSSVFMPVRDESQGRSIRDEVAALGAGQALLVRSLNRHPLRDWAFSGISVDASASIPGLSRDGIEQLGSSQVG